MERYKAARQHQEKIYESPSKHINISAHAQLDTLCHVKSLIIVAQKIIREPYRVKNAYLCRNQMTAHLYWYRYNK